MMTAARLAARFCGAAPAALRVCTCRLPIEQSWKLGFVASAKPGRGDTSQGATVGTPIVLLSVSANSLNTRYENRRPHPSVSGAPSVAHGSTPNWLTHGCGGK